MIKETFDLPNDAFTTFEFYWVPPRAERINGDRNCSFRSEADVSIICLKERSLIYFLTHYRFETKNGCGPKATVRLFGGKNHEQAEIHFNKISTVSMHHTEKTIEVINPGCAGSTGKYVFNQDGFKIRAGENFEVIANE